MESKKKPLKWGEIEKILLVYLAFLFTSVAFAIGFAACGEKRENLIGNPKNVEEKSVQVTLMGSSPEVASYNFRALVKEFKPDDGMYSRPMYVLSVPIIESPYSESLTVFKPDFPISVGDSVTVHAERWDGNNWNYDIIDK